VRIGELAEHMALNPRTIRYYESIRLLPEPDRTASGYRAYDEADVERLAFIRSAQRLGLALDEIREVLALRERGEVPCGYVRELISKEIVDVDRRLEELRGLRQELVGRPAEVKGDSARSRYTAMTYPTTAPVLSSHTHALVSERPGSHVRS
jgi:DNA-binding transcriptional MerR regulator